MPKSKAEDSLESTPKRQRLDQDSLRYLGSDDSIVDSDDDHETVATIPIPRQARDNDSDVLSSPMHITQPTQIVERPSAVSSIVQVPASSPLRPSTINKPLSSAMAPAGTVFRAPPIMTVRQRPVIDLDNDEPHYVGGSSDEDELGNTNDIKPVQFKKNTASQKENETAASRFHSILNNSRYSGQPPKTSASTLDARPQASRDISSHFIKTSDQNRPSRAQPILIEDDSDSDTDNLSSISLQILRELVRKAMRSQNMQIDLTDIKELPLRNRVEGLMRMCPGRTVRECIDALLDAKGRFPVAKAALRAPSSNRDNEDESNRLTLDRIPDAIIRKRVERLQSLLPKASVRKCYDSLVRHGGNYDKALLALQNEKLDEDESIWITETLSDDEIALAQPRRATTTAARKGTLGSGNVPGTSTAKRIDPKVIAKKATKQVLTGPRKTFNEKYGTGIKGKTKLSSTSEPQPDDSEEEEEAVSTPEASDDSDAGPVSARVLPDRRKRLQRGTKPAKSPSPIASEDEDSDAEVGFKKQKSRKVVVEDLEEQTLNFFNTAEVKDMIATLSLTSANDQALAQHVVASRPFGDVDEIESLRRPTAPGKRKAGGPPFGANWVSRYEESVRGYKALDDVVAKCAEFAEPIKEEMEYWPVDMYGKSKTAEKTVDSTKGKANGSTVDNAVVNGDEIDSKENQIIPPIDDPDFPGQPDMMSSDVTVKPYQIVGMHWLTLMFKQGLGGILADDMGLGKTCQVIAFLAHLYEKENVQGPHLVICPASVIENWLREFKRFCPKLKVHPFYEDGRTNFYINSGPAGEEDRKKFNVIITTYETAKAADTITLTKRLRPYVLVLDEGQKVKNSNAIVSTVISKIPANFRLLLSGTPVQNNLQELVNILQVVLPKLFDSGNAEIIKKVFNVKSKTSAASHDSLLYEKHTTRARALLAPFILQRKKAQVIELPKKTRRVIYCKMTETQRAAYEEATHFDVYDMDKDERKERLMALRKLSNHAMYAAGPTFFSEETMKRIADHVARSKITLYRGYRLVLEDLQVLSNYEVQSLCLRHDGLNKYALSNDEWMPGSGKVAKLIELLTEFRKDGSRTLLFSQFTMNLDILEWVLNTLAIKFVRFDGGVKTADRLDLIDKFYAETDIEVFLLSTGAGGAGINLACANKVIIFDSGFNPQEDVQAENRAHRLGQTRPVEVIRFVTEDTIDVGIHRLGLAKLALERKVAGGPDAGGDHAGDKIDDEQEVEAGVLEDVGDGLDEDARKVLDEEMRKIIGVGKD